MRTNRRTVTTLDTGFRVPHGDLFGNIPFFVLSCAEGIASVSRQFGYGNVIAAAGNNLTSNFFYELRCIIGDNLDHMVIALGLLRVIHLFDCFKGHVDGLDILVDHILSLLGVGLLDVFLNEIDSLVFGQYAGDLEESSLHDHVDAGTHTGGFSDLEGIDYVELEFFINDLLLYFDRNIIPYLVLIERRVQKEDAALFGVLEHVVAFEE